jgi:hypothetical protein
MERSLLAGEKRDPIAVYKDRNVLLGLLS